MAQKVQKGLPMEGFIARFYDETVKGERRKELQLLARRLKDEAPEGGNLLEIAPGPGYLSIELAKLGNFKIAGLDASKTLVEIARRHAGEEGVTIDFRQGNAAYLPFPDNAFDLAYCTAAFKNFQEPQKAMREMFRVVKPGGKAFIEDMKHNMTDEELTNYVRHTMKLKGLKFYMMKYMFKFSLQKRAYTKAQFEEFITGAGFKQYEIKEGPLGFEILLAKERI
jgi:ubiquinone/menaquinone biosynthesis C-methylase UbiE